MPGQPFSPKRWSHHKWLLRLKTEPQQDLKTGRFGSKIQGKGSILHDNRHSAREKRQMKPNEQPIFIGDTRLRPAQAEVAGEYVPMLGELFYKIH